MATTADLINAAVSFATSMANDNTHGYSLNTRSLYNITNPTSFDCSSLVLTAWYYAFKQYGLTTQASYLYSNCSYTGDMLNMTNVGFQVVARSQTSSSGMQKGDIELNVQDHTAMAIDSSTIVAARSAEGTTNTTDDSGNEITTQAWYSYPWNYRLRFTGTGVDVGSANSGGASAVASSSAATCTISKYGILSGTDNTLYIAWKCSASGTHGFNVQWSIRHDGAWFNQEATTSNVQNTTYSVPSYATAVRVRIQPIFEKTVTKNNTTTTETYYGAYSQWQTVYKASTGGGLSTPSAPTVSMKNNTLTATISNLDDAVKKVEFQYARVAGTQTISKSTTVATKLNAASASWTVVNGYNYKVRCRSYNSDGDSSDWSDYSDSIQAAPTGATGISVAATSTTSAKVSWSTDVSATSYEVQWTTKEDYFDSSSVVESFTVETNIGYANITGLDTGEQWFFRVKAINDGGESEWSSIVSVILGEAPTAPTIWSSIVTAKDSDTINLYWVHNAEDGSSETKAEIEIVAVREENKGTTTDTISVENTKSEDEKDKTSKYTITASAYTFDGTITWRVRTAGITGEFGDWSEQRVINVYTTPVATLNIYDVNMNEISTMTSFPIRINCWTAPAQDAPIGHQVSITANSSYDIVDGTGNTIHVSSGDEVYSKWINAASGDTGLVLYLYAGDVIFDSGTTYTVTVTASLNNGLSATDSTTLSVSFASPGYSPSATVALNDSDQVTTTIQPMCGMYSIEFHVCTRKSSSTYTLTSEILSDEEKDYVIQYETLTSGYASGNPVFASKRSSGTTVYYAKIASSTVLVTGVTLAVYRREFDGDLTEIASGIENNGYSYVVDPHPALDYARYRIVATDTTTGLNTFTDLAGFHMNIKYIVLQWDEEWSNFDYNDNYEGDLDGTIWSGSTLKLPYNIDVSEDNDPDVNTVEYIGRKHPVSYYGTQTGETATWNVDVQDIDKETIYALRRLAVWMGDVYVREPSGSGYWAHVKVSFRQKHVDRAVPVTLEITRVEGGM